MRKKLLFRKTLRSVISIFLSLFMIMYIVNIHCFNINNSESNLFVVAAATEKWSWPVPPTSKINQYFSGTGTNQHSGIDIGGTGNFAAVIATRTGTVVQSYPKRCIHINSGSGHDCQNQGVTYGNYIVLEHIDDNGNKWYSLYAHLVYDSIKYKVGDTVPQGAVLGQVGSSGASTGTHLHFEIRKSANKYANVVNPMNYVTLNTIYRTTLDSNMTYRLPSDKTKLPALLSKGKAFDVYGLIYSNREITKVWGGIYEQGTNTKVQYCEDTPKTYLYSLYSKFDKNLLFDKLSEGYYTYRIYAKDDTKEYKLVEQNFQVGNPTKDFTVTLNANGGNVSTNSIKVTVGNTYSSLPTPTRKGYTFAGWYTAATGGTKIVNGTSVTTAANHTLYAQWTAKSYTISYDANGGNCPVDTQSIKYDAEFINIPTAERNGYVFDGWYSSVSGGTKYTISSKMTTDSNINLYAHWTTTNNTSEGVMIGDINLDGSFDKNDILALQSHLLNKNPLQTFEQGVAADVLSDSVIDSFDLCVLRRMYIISQSSITISDTKKNMIEGDTYQLTASVSPTPMNIEWKSSDSNIVIVENGKMTAVSAGEATITAYIQTNSLKKIATCNVSVEAPAITLSSTSGSSSDTNIYKSGSDFYAIITSLPKYTSNVSGGTVSWSVVSGNATISNNKLYINQPGTVTARVTLTYGGKTYTADYKYTRIVTFTADVAYTLRSKPSTSGSSLASVPKGTKLTVSAIDSSDSTYIWGKVTYGSQTGYVILWKKDGSDGGIITE